MPDSDIAAIITAVDRVSLKLDTATTTALTANERATTAEAANRDLATRITTLEGINTAQAAEIVRLQAIIDDGPPPDPPPPTTGVTLIGATIDRRNGETEIGAIANFETAIGAKIGVRRVFIPSKTLTFSATRIAADKDRSIVLSVKGTYSDNEWDTFIDSLPRDGHQRWLVWQHEPENDGGTMTPAYFRAGCDRLAAAIKRSGRTDVIPTLVLMTWLERDTTTGTSSATWFPTNPADFCLALDPYDPNSNKTLQQQTLPTVTLWRQAGGHRWGIGETGTHRTGTAGASWITTGLQWAHDEGADFVCYFHSAVGAEGPWWLDDPAMRQAFGRLCPAIT